jgi:hypothetical protein
MSPGAVLSYAMARAMVLILQMELDMIKYLNGMKFNLHKQVDFSF